MDRLAAVKERYHLVCDETIVDTAAARLARHATVHLLERLSTRPSARSATTLGSDAGHRVQRGDGRTLDMPSTKTRAAACLQRATRQHATRRLAHRRTAARVEEHAWCAPRIEATPHHSAARTTGVLKLWGGVGAGATGILDMETAMCPMSGLCGREREHTEVARHDPGPRRAGEPHANPCPTRGRWKPHS